MATNGPFHSIRAPRMSLEIVKQIQEAIFRGDYTPGMRLPTERELVQSFGVSKVTVREALRILETYGLVRIRAGASGGAFVNEVTSRAVSQAAYNMLQLEGFRSSDLYAARLLFEPPVTELACRSATEEDLRAMEDSIARARKLMTDGQNMAAESQEFHAALIRAARNGVIELILSSLLDLVVLTGSIVPAKTYIPQMVVDDHQAILEAVRQKDAARARALMEDHLRRLGVELVRMEEQGIEVADDAEGPDAPLAPGDLRDTSASVRTDPSDPSLSAP